MADKADFATSSETVVMLNRKELGYVHKIYLSASELVPALLAKEVDVIMGTKVDLRTVNHAKALEDMNLQRSGW